MSLSALLYVYCIATRQVPRWDAEESPLNMSLWNVCEYTPHCSSQWKDVPYICAPPYGSQMLDTRLMYRGVIKPRRLTDPLRL